jgi:predicted TIM-barrel fold metal-dependent hydrolase
MDDLAPAIKAIDGLSKEDQAKVLYRNAEKIFNLD